MCMCLLHYYRTTMQILSNLIYEQLMICSCLHKQCHSMRNMRLQTLAHDRFPMPSNRWNFTIEFKSKFAYMTYQYAYIYVIRREQGIRSNTFCIECELNMREHNAATVHTKKKNRRHTSKRSMLIQSSYKLEIYVANQQTYLPLRLASTILIRCS